MLLTLLGMVIEVREEQPRKASSPMLVRLAGRIIFTNLDLALKYTPSVFVIPDKSTSTSEVIVPCIQLKSALLSVPVRINLATNAGRFPASKINSDNVPGVATWRVRVFSLLTNAYSFPHAV